MGTLLLRLIGPMQSWGVQSNFTHRDTGLEPSKSGVVGLICAAMGRRRNEPIDDLAALRMGVRVDREGLVKYDYHTAKDVLKASGAGIKDTEVSYRYYLADAAFLVGLEGSDAELLSDIHHHLRNPAWFLFLGRKAFVPSEAVWLDDGLKIGQDLETALRSYPRLRPKRSPFEDNRTRLMIEESQRGDIARPDQPISFAKGHRQFTVRRLYADFCTPPSAQEGQ
jgi:CRISPR system Cascade subunit CasD